MTSWIDMAAVQHGAEIALRDQQRRAKRSYNELYDDYFEYINQTRAHVHLLRSVAEGRKRVLEILVDEIAKYDPSNPLVSKEKVLALSSKIGVELLHDEKLIARTYPKGDVPYFNSKIFDKYFTIEGDDDNPAMFVKHGVVAS